MNMNKLALSLVMAMGIVSGAQAATNGGSGTVEFKGDIVDAPCSISSESSAQIVPMGTATVKTLANKGKATAVPFDIKLQGCEATTQKVKIAFDGVAADSSKKYLKLANGTAAGAGIGLTDHNGADLVLGTSTVVKDTLLEGDNVLNFQAYVQGIDASVTPGSFDTTANFTLSYE